MKSKRPRTAKQIAASRANGAKSQGPKTGEGKAISSLNSLKHGAYAEQEHILSNEQTHAFDQLRAAFYEKFNPSGDVEGGLVEEMAYAQWRMRRFWFAQDAAVSLEMNRQDPHNAKTFVNIDEPTRVALAMTYLLDNSKGLEFMYRSEARFRRQYTRALNDLLKLQSLRPSQTLPAPAETKNEETNLTPTQLPPPQPLPRPPVAHFRPAPTPIHLRASVAHSLPDPAPIPVHSRPFAAHTLPDPAPVPSLPNKAGAL
jgi:hypothetical protein